MTPEDFPVTAGVVHIAGPFEEGVQRCAHCGTILIDYRGTAVMVAEGGTPTLGGWAVSAHVMVDGRYSAVVDSPVNCSRYVIQ